MLIVCRSRTKKRWLTKQIWHLSVWCVQAWVVFCPTFPQSWTAKGKKSKTYTGLHLGMGQGIGYTKKTMFNNQKLIQNFLVLSRYWTMFETSNVNHERLMNSGYQQSLVRTARSNPALKVSLEFPRWYQQNEVVVGITQCSNRLLVYWMVPHFCSWNLIIPSLATLTV